MMSNQLSQTLEKISISGFLKNGERAVVILETKEALKHQPDAILPKNIVLRLFDKSSHTILDYENNSSEQDLSWAPGIWFLDNIDFLYKENKRSQEEFYSQVNSDIEKKKKLKDSVPTGIEVIQTLHQTGLLPNLLESQDINAVIGLLVYTLVIPNEEKGVLYFKRILQNLKTPLTSMEKEAILQIIENLGIIKE